MRQSRWQSATNYPLAGFACFKWKFVSKEYCLEGTSASVVPKRRDLNHALHLFFASTLAYINKSDVFAAIPGALFAGFQSHQLLWKATKIMNRIRLACSRNCWRLRIPIRIT